MLNQICSITRILSFVLMFSCNTIGGKEVELLISVENVSVVRLWKQS